MTHKDCKEWKALRHQIESECIIEEHVDFNIHIRKSDVEDIKAAMIEEFKTSDRVIFVINPPKGLQRGRFFVNGPRKEADFIRMLIANASERLEKLENPETQTEITVQPQDSVKTTKL